MLLFRLCFYCFTFNRRSSFLEFYGMIFYVIFYVSFPVLFFEKKCERFFNSFKFKI